MGISDAFGLIVVIAALVPGLGYLRAYRRYTLYDVRTSTVEFVEMLAIGALGTSVAAIIVLAIGEVAPGLVTLRALFHGYGDLSKSPWGTIVSAAGILLLGTVGCITAGVLAGQHSRRRVGVTLAGVPAEERAAGPAFREGSQFAAALLRGAPDGGAPFLAVELSDGRLVEGFALLVSHHDDPLLRDLTLQKPVAFSGPGYTGRTVSPANRVFVPGSMIRLIHIAYPEPNGGGTHVGDTAT
ncbi:DUF6338 family protein [Frankia sp. Cas4]|uniref:DUF6338 family protein n=1 Tax=Frankia sp. Cas4 TaxID=3073927 RepID=UPI002AD22638|nr:DUF6338 family protein [Frankia sp. Cas4]